LARFFKGGQLGFGRAKKIELSLYHSKGRFVVCGGPQPRRKESGKRSVLHCSKKMEITLLGKRKADAFSNGRKKSRGERLRVIDTGKSEGKYNAWGGGGSHYSRCGTNQKKTKGYRDKGSSKREKFLGWKRKKKEKTFFGYPRTPSISYPFGGGELKKKCSRGAGLERGHGDPRKGSTMESIHD